MFLIDRRSCFAAAQKNRDAPGSPVAFETSNTDLMVPPAVAAGLNSIERLP
jgi:hypothetical protein